jgi:hypothetical protein
MSFSTRDTELIEFAKDVVSMEDELKSIPFPTLVAIHNELILHSEDYRVIGGYAETDRIILATPDGVSAEAPAGLDNIVGSLFDLQSEYGALLRAVVYYLGTDALVRAPASEETEGPRFKPIYQTGIGWRGAVHKMAVFFAIRHKTPQEMFGEKFFPVTEGVRQDDAHHDE